MSSNANLNYEKGLATEQPLAHGLHEMPHLNGPVEEYGPKDAEKQTAKISAISHNNSRPKSQVPAGQKNNMDILGFIPSSVRPNQPGGYHARHITKINDSKQKQVHGNLAEEHFSAAVNEVRKIKNSPLSSADNIKESHGSQTPHRGSAHVANSLTQEQSKEIQRLRDELSAARSQIAIMGQELSQSSSGTTDTNQAVLTPVTSQSGPSSTFDYSNVFESAYSKDSVQEKRGQRFANVPRLNVNFDTYAADSQVQANASSHHTASEVRPGSSWIASQPAGKFRTSMKPIPGITTGRFGSMHQHNIQGPPSIPLAQGIDFLNRDNTPPVQAASSAISHNAWNPYAGGNAPVPSPPITPYIGGQTGMPSDYLMLQSRSTAPFGLSPTAMEFTVAGNTPHGHPVMFQAPWSNSVSCTPTQNHGRFLTSPQQPVGDSAGATSLISSGEPVNYRRMLDRNVSCNWKLVVDKIVSSNDQQASIFLQQKLKVAPVNQKIEIVDAIIAQAYPLMINRFGNFLVQRCFEHGTPSQVISIAKAIRGNTLNLSMDAFGCHVIQKAFDVVPEEYKAIMVHELLRRIPETVVHRYACHVWQKLFELRWSDSPPQIMKYVNEALLGMWHEVAMGETGSLVVQNIFENCLEEDKRPCIDEVLDNIDVISHGQFGNWCIQHICEHGASPDKRRAIEHVLSFASDYSTDQFASKVVEKCMKIGGSEFLDHYLERVCEGRPDRPRMPLIDIAGDQYGNYLIQYILVNAEPVYKEIVAQHVRKHMVSLRGSKFGSRVAMLCGPSGFSTRSVSANVVANHGRATTGGQFGSSVPQSGQGALLYSAPSIEHGMANHFSGTLGLGRNPFR